MTDAVDVAGWQGPIDGAALYAAGVRVGIVKVSEGGSPSNDHAAQQVATLAGNGIRVGAYHFARPDIRGLTAEAEAEAFVSAARAVGVPDDAVVALDLEPFPGQGWPLDAAATVDYVDRWARRVAVRAPTWERCWYSYPSFVATLLPIDKRIDPELGCWIADPTNFQNGRPPRTGGRPWVLGQTGTGPIDGINGEADLDLLGPAYQHPPTTEEPMPKVMQSPSSIIVVDGLNAVGLTPDEVDDAIRQWGAPVPTDDPTVNTLIAISSRLQAQGVSSAPSLPPPAAPGISEAEADVARTALQTVIDEANQALRALAD